MCSATAVSALEEIAWHVCPDGVHDGHYEYHPLTQKAASKHSTPNAMCQQLKPDITPSAMKVEHMFVHGVRTDALPAVLPAGKLVGLRGKRPDSPPNPLLWLLWYMLSAASAAASPLSRALTSTHATLSRLSPCVLDRRWNLCRFFHRSGSGCAADPAGGLACFWCRSNGTRLGPIRTGLYGFSETYLGVMALEDELSPLPECLAGLSAQGEAEKEVVAVVR